MSAYDRRRHQLHPSCLVLNSQNVIKQPACQSFSFSHLLPLPSVCFSGDPCCLPPAAGSTQQISGSPMPGIDAAHPTPFLLATTHLHSVPQHIYHCSSCLDANVLVAASSACLREVQHATGHCVSVSFFLFIAHSLKTSLASSFAMLRRNREQRLAGLQAFPNCAASRVLAWADARQACAAWRSWPCRVVY